MRASKFTFQILTICLKKDRRQRLREELDSDLSHTGGLSQDKAIINSYAVRALLDLGRVQHLQPFIFGLVTLGVFIASVRTRNISLVGLFVFLTIFARPSRRLNVNTIAYDVFFLFSFFMCLLATILGSTLGIGLGDERLAPFTMVLVGIQTLTFIAYLVLSFTTPDRVSLKSHIFARALHMVFVNLFLINMLLGNMEVGFPQTIVFGTLGWLAILLIGAQKPRELSRPNRKD